MAYRRYNLKPSKFGPGYTKGFRRSRSKVTMGKMFRTKRGILGCYKYVNGRRVSFVRKYRR